MNNSSRGSLRSGELQYSEAGHHRSQSRHAAAFVGARSATTSKASAIAPAASVNARQIASKPLKAIDLGSSRAEVGPPWAKRPSPVRRKRKLQAVGRGNLQDGLVDTAVGKDAASAGGGRGLASHVGDLTTGSLHQKPRARMVPPLDTAKHRTVVASRRHPGSL